MAEIPILREVDEVVDSDVSLEAKKIHLFGLAQHPTILRALAEALLLKAHVQARVIAHFKAEAAADAVGKGGVA